MRERPRGFELLEIARTTLREKIIKNLPAELQYDALMIANAMAIAARQLDFGERPEKTELASLQRIVSEKTVSVNSAPDQEQHDDNWQAELIRLNTVLAKGIRNGDFDNNATVKAHLWAAAVQKCKESAPKALG